MMDTRNVLRCFDEIVFRFMVILERIWVDGCKVKMYGEQSHFFCSNLDSHMWNHTSYYVELNSIF